MRKRAVPYLVLVLIIVYLGVVLYSAFGTDGTEKTSGREMPFAMNTCSGQACDNSPANGLVDSGKTCSGTFATWFQKNSYKTMSFTNGWAYVDGEWVFDHSNNWYWFQGNCSLGTYPRTLFINRTTGWAYGAINCNQTGSNYCPELTCTSFTYFEWDPVQCPLSQKQTRKILESFPEGCTGGSPITSHACNYTGKPGPMSLSVNYLSSRLLNGEGAPNFAADPFVLREKGVYYLYFTGNDNIPVYKSYDFINWIRLDKAFAGDNIAVPGKLGWDTSLSADYSYHLLWAPEVTKFNNIYVMTFSGTQSPPISLEGGNSGQSIWLAYSSSPEGPFGPNPATGERMNEPIPVRNYRWGFDANQPHTVLENENFGSGDPNKMRIDSSFFKDADGSLWMSYVWSDWQNQISIVKLDSLDISLTSQTSPESFQLIDNKDVKPGPACLFYNYTSRTDFIVPDRCIAEASQIIIRNGKYYLFYSSNAFDSNSYNTYYKMANSLRCLAYGKESDISCGVKEGVAFNGSASIYSYGHGTLIEGPDGKQLFHVLTVMIDSLKSFRGLWVAEQQFNSDGTPKYSTPKLDDVVIINLTCINQYCDNSPADGIMDDGRFCNTTFSSWFQKNSYKTMSFTNGWAYADGEWITDVGSGWYWFQGNCSLGTYPRNLFINRTTGWAYGAINCMQNGAYYCSEP